MPKRSSFGQVTGIPEARLASGLILSNGLDCLSVCFFVLLLLHHSEIDDEVTNHSHAPCVDMIMSRRKVRVSLTFPTGNLYNPHWLVLEPVTIKEDDRLPLNSSGLLLELE